MKQLHQNRTAKYGWLARGYSTLLATLSMFVFCLVYVQSALAGIDNDAIAIGIYEGSPVASAVSSQSVPVIGGGAVVVVTEPVETVTELVAQKTLISAREVLPNVVDVEYRLRLSNTGTTLITNITLLDNLNAAIALPASILGSGSIVSMTGFTGTGGLNSSYDGISNDQILSGDVQLEPSQIGDVHIKVRIDRKSQGLDIDNVAIVAAPELPSPIATDDPTRTPADTNDINNTVFDRPDSDNDGSFDGNESASSDRDGDGIPDAEDYDPTGYLYCESDGRILLEGQISVQNVATGGIQTGVGRSNDINIIHDGVAGFYQFYVTAPGRYRLSVERPKDGIPSLTHLSSGTLDVTSLLPNNPGVLGAGEVRKSGFLNDTTPGGNPFYTEFDIDIGDPTVFNNNIPHRWCGPPSIAVTKTVSAGPTINADGGNDVTYRIVMENDGEIPLDNVAMVDDLNNVFGEDFRLNSHKVEAQPAGFNAVPDPFFDGSSNKAMITRGGTLLPGESVTMVMDVEVSTSPGDYINTVVVNAEHPLSGEEIGEEADTAEVTIIHSSAQRDIVASKETPLDSVLLGSAVPYTITFDNRSRIAVRNADVIDFLPPGFSYVRGSAKLNDVAVEPTKITARELVWSGQNIRSNGRLTITLNLLVGAATPGTEFVNTTYMRDPFTGSTISNHATAKVRLEIESQFHCSHVIGRVFNDLDKDGYHDEGEPGLAGVRVVSVNGLLITTDAYGRYHIACDAIPADRIGSNYILKLDERTLPTGYSLTSENPRVVRLTRGKLAKINFAAASLRKINLELSNASFKRGTEGLTSQAIQDIARLLPLLDEERSLLQIDYRPLGKGTTLERSRLKSVTALIKRAWTSRKRKYKLQIDAKVNSNSVNY